MLENSSAEKSTPEAPRTDAAFWDVPGAGWKIIYSLPLFHEIDFVVNEGYRKIPHGGIEEGGLLFGTIESDAVRIEAFRPIACEHAAGPSLNLSDRDLVKLEEQLSGYAADKELENLQPVGWFLTHTRGPLELTDAEVKNFERFFPGPRRITVLVKPERFQPTRFGFLTRQPDGEIDRDASGIAVILPLPGRSNKSGELVPSIPAPAPGTKLGVKAALDEDLLLPETDQVQTWPPPPKQPFAEPPRASNLTDPGDLPKKQDLEPLSIWKIPPDADLTPTEAEAPAEDIPAIADFRTAEEKAARKQRSRERARVIEEAFPTPPTAPRPETPPSPPFRPIPLPSLPANLPRPPAAQYPRAPVQRTDTAHHLSETVFNVRTITALALAALLGCGVGYIAYLQLPAPVIPIDVRQVNQTMVVSWPPDETRNAIYAAVRVNDAPPVPLSSQEKKAGRIALAALQDFKLEVMARNWIRDSRGIVKYIHTESGNSGKVQPAPASTLP